MVVDFDRVRKRIAGYRDEMVALQADLTAIPALGPENGGEGEQEKAARLRHFLEGLTGLEIEEIRAPDNRVPSGFRPNLIARRPGKKPRPRTWVLTHLDVVPAGETGLWTKDPFHLWVEDGKIYGRGVEDNQQSMVASLFALRALQEERLDPPRDIALALVADEETGSRYGLQYVLRQRSDLFHPQDLILVPDFGDPEAGQIEIAEKSILWLRFQILGKQCHASRPQDGVNTLRAASHLVVRLDSLSGSFSDADPLYDPPTSTFEPTKKEANVPNINTIPGEDVLYMDCRILPQYRIEEVEQKVQEIAKQVEVEFGVAIQVSPAQRDQAAPPTSGDAPVVGMARQAIREVYGKEAQLVGIGGGTVAAFFRRTGHQAAALSKIDRTAHQPNEYCKIDNMLRDCQVFAHCFLQPSEEEEGKR
jgi:succinyl-diaminopimelate desuccinylase